MHRLKYLDFDNQMATFPFFHYDCEQPDLNLDQKSESAWKHDPNRPHSKMNPNPNLNTFSGKPMQLQRGWIDRTQTSRLVTEKALPIPATEGDGVTLDDGVGLGIGLGVGEGGIIFPICAKARSRRRSL